MTNQKTPQRGNTNIGKDGVQNLGRFAPNTTNADNPDDRLAQIETDDSGARTGGFLLGDADFDEANNNTNLLNDINSDVIAEMESVWAAAGIFDYELDVSADKIRVVPGWDAFKVRKVDYALTVSLPDVWLEKSKIDYELVEVALDYALELIDEARLDWAVVTAENIQGQLEGERPDFSDWNAADDEDEYY